MITSLLFVVSLFSDTLHIKTPIYHSYYSEQLEQPYKVVYESTNRPKNIKRDSFTFYTIPSVHTSDNADYANNIWDRGHMAPAASFSSSKEILHYTFSYANVALQHQDLNRGEWARLEHQERVWDDTEPLVVTITLVFFPTSKKLRTGATVPDGFHKHIYYTTTLVTRCWYFPNTKPNKSWVEYEEADCNH